MLRCTYRIGLVAAVLGGGCAPPNDDPEGGTEGSDTGEPLPPAGIARVRFEPAQGPLEFASVPFPSELYRDDAGRIAIGALPNAKSDAPMLTAVRQLLAMRSGFCATCNITFAIEGGLDVASLPEPGTDPDLDDAVVLVDVDPASPDHGRLVPVRTQWDAEHGWLSLRPARGFALHGGRAYAAVVGSSARGGDGLPIGPADAFVAVRDGDVDDAVAAAIDPALVQLQAIGIPREHVVGLAAFTTEDPTADLRAIRAAVRASDAPAIAIDAVFEGEAIDDLLGVPAEDRPGVDVPPAEGVEGTSAIGHVSTRLVVAGRFSAPRFVSGSGIDVGATTRAPDGTPIAERVEDVPFVLIVPRDVDLTRLPVVVSHHGFNASRTTGFAIADTAGRAGFAVLAIDAYQHGDRAASAMDVEHAMRGIDGPDGFAETSKLDVSMRVFGLGGVAPQMTLYPGYPLGAFEQFAADAMAAVRLVAEGDLAALRAADPSLASLAFDRERIAYVGNSMGSVVGTGVLVAEPDVRAAVLDVMPGSIMETLAESGEFRTLTETLLLPQIGVDGEFDEVERALLFDPTVDVFRWALEPVDPLALAPYVVADRVVEGTPDVLVQLAGHDEVAAPTASESVLAAAGIAGHGAFAFAPVQSWSADASPFVGAVRFDGAMHGMLEVASQSSAWQEPLDPPLVARDGAIRLDNPIVDVHAQIEVFLASFAEEGHGAIVP